MAKRLSTEAQSKRDQMMACESLRGVSDIDIAMRHEVSLSTVQRGKRRSRAEAPSLSELDAIEEMEVGIARLYAAIDELAGMRGPGNPAEVRIEAIGSQRRIMKDIWELKRAMGLVPDLPSDQMRRDFASDFWAWSRLRLEKEMGWDPDGVQFMHFLIEDWLENGNKKPPPPFQGG